MKILLVAINAKYIHSNLAVYSLKSYAKEYSENIEIAEYTINNYTDDILQEIYKEQADVIAFSCYIWNIEIVNVLIVELSKLMPQTEIWLGGPEVSYTSIKMLEKYPQLKGIMSGEGEEIFANLARHYVESDISLSDIKGITFRNADCKIVQNQMESIMNLSDVPFVYEDLQKFENKIIYYESSRGCPFSCSYCLSSIDKKLRFRDIELVKKELKYFLENKVAQVKFVDRTFNCHKERTLEIWRFLLENDNGTTNFHFEVSADLINDEELALIKQMRPGLIQLEIGVQSTNPKTIQEIDRTMNLEKLTNYVNQVRAFENVHQHLDLIAGLPYEDMESFQKSFNDVYLMRPDQLQLGFLKVLSGSKMYNNAKQYGIVYKETPPYEVLYTQWLKYDDILTLKAVEEVVEIYYNSGQFTNTMKCFEREFDTPYQMYEALSNHYHMYTLNKEKHSRIALYEILLEYISSNFKDKIKAYTNVLILDCYLRDNIKTRPSFARKLDQFKLSIQSIYKIEAETREVLKDYAEYNYKQLINMTHIEVFDIDVEQFVDTGVVVDKDIYILFDYKNRNPLNNSSKTILVNNSNIK